MITFDFGDVVLVPFPFTDQSTAKQRPAVVVSSDGYHRSRPDIILLAITSQQGHASPFDVDIQHWQHARLLRPSVFKPLITTVERQLIRKKLGQLHGDDRQRVSELLRNMLGA